MDQPFEPRHGSKLIADVQRQQRQHGPGQQPGGQGGGDQAGKHPLKQQREEHSARQDIQDPRTDFEGATTIFANVDKDDREFWMRPRESCHSRLRRLWIERVDHERIKVSRHHQKVEHARGDDQQCEHRHRAHDAESDFHSQQFQRRCGQTTQELIGPFFSFACKRHRQTRHRENRRQRHQDSDQPHRSRMVGHSVGDRVLGVEDPHESKLQHDCRNKQRQPQWPQRAEFLPSQPV